MVKKIDTALVRLWGDIVGAVSWLENHDYGIFEYEPSFLKKNLDISPINMSIDAAKQSNHKFSFTTLNRDTFFGLPGLLADSLPDKFGHAIIDSWLTRNGRVAAHFNPVERLCYMGNRGMGALEFSPMINGKYNHSVSVEISELVNLVQQIMNHQDNQNTKMISDILRVGTSAGGARPKAIIALDNQGHVLSGQAKAPEGYDYWILKFDGVTDLELGEPKGYGRIEYAYYLMAQAAGIHMAECRLLEENGRAHFITKRFDRVKGEKIHMHSLCGLAHYDFNLAGAYSYEQAFSVMRKLRLSKVQAQEFYRRMVFNVVARNLDDHTKNISFLMDHNGEWKLSPAYDVIYAHNPKGQWTSQHQMTINGKRDHISIEDLIMVAKTVGCSDPQVIIEVVMSAVKRWPEFAEAAKLNKEIMREIQANHLIL